MQDGSDTQSQTFFNKMFGFICFLIYPYRHCFLMCRSRRCKSKYYKSPSHHFTNAGCIYNSPICQQNHFLFNPFYLISKILFLLSLKNSYTFLALFNNISGLGLFQSEPPLSVLWKIDQSIFILWHLETPGTWPCTPMSV